MTPLTPRQLQILQLMADGLSHKEIAHRLGIAKRTVDNIMNMDVATHSVGAYQRLGATCAHHAVAIGLRAGLIK